MIAILLLNMCWWWSWSWWFSPFSRSWCKWFCLSGCASLPLARFPSIYCHLHHDECIRNPACLYVYVCKKGCMYDVCIELKIHTHTYIFNISVFCLYCMYVCMCMYVYVSVEIFEDIQTHTHNTYSYIQYIQYMQYMQIHTDTHNTYNTWNTDIYM